MNFKTNSVLFVFSEPGSLRIERLDVNLDFLKRVLPAHDFIINLVEMSDRSYEAILLIEELFLKRKDSSTNPYAGTFYVKPTYMVDLSDSGGRVLLRTLSQKILGK